MQPAHVAAVAEQVHRSRAGPSRVDLAPQRRHATCRRRRSPAAAGAARPRARANASISRSNRFCGSSRPTAPRTMASAGRPSSARADASTRVSRRNVRGSIPVEHRGHAFAVGRRRESARGGSRRHRDHVREARQQPLVDRIVERAARAACARSSRAPSTAPARRRAGAAMQREQVGLVFVRVHDVDALLAHQPPQRGDHRRVERVPLGDLDVVDAEGLRPSSSMAKTASRASRM